MISRRTLLKNGLLSTAAAALLSPADLRAFGERKATLSDTLARSNPVDERYWELVKSQFILAEGLHYFNNGSLGASPEYVAGATEKFRRTLDGFPSKYMWGGWDEQKEEVRSAAAELFGVSPETVALIHNTTEGMNLIASSMDLEAGEEVLLSNHEHSSARVPWNHWQGEKGVVLKTVELPLLPKSKAEIVERFESAITPRTRVISIVHVTNTNGMRLPVREISEMAHRHGVRVAVDGAQSMGMFRFSLEELGCDFFTSSAHKWLFAPKGMGLFYAREEAQSNLKPLIVCRGYEDRSIRRFENYNTRNLPELLGLGAALDFRRMIGPERIEARVFELKRYLREKLANDDRFRFKTPESDELSAGIQTVEVVDQAARDVRRKLTEEYRIDCRPMGSHDINGLRISLAIFNTKAEVDYLVTALTTIAES